MSVQLGINPLTWTNDDLPSLGAETPLDTCLSEGKEAGFAGFELGNKFPREARLLGPICSATICSWSPAGIQGVCWSVAWRRRLPPCSPT